MRNQIPNRGNWIEDLENRRLLSASGVGSSAWSTAAITSGWFMSPDASTPNVVGTFTGTFGGSSGTGALTLQITGQSRRGALTGTLTTKQRHQHSFTFPFTGKITGNSVKITDYDGDNTTIKGTVSGRHNNVISGTFSGPDGKGTFSVTLT